MRTRVFAVFSLAVCLPVLAQHATALRASDAPNISDLSIPFAEAIQNLRANQRSVEGLKPTPNVVLEGAESTFIFPVVGSAGVFHTETVLVNRLNRTQRLNLYYLPIAGGAANCSKPGRAMDLDAKRMYLFTDFVTDVFGEGGFGSVVVIGADSGNNPDSSARIDGNSRIWSLATGGGTASQNFPSMSVAVPAGQQSAFGLRSDEFYRTNWGIFNYDTVTRTFDILFSGFRNPDVQITKDIPPCSLIQERVPGGPYGSMEIVFAPRDNGGLFYAYGSTVDNASSDSWSVPGRK